MERGKKGREGNEQRKVESVARSIKKRERKREKAGLFWFLPDGLFQRGEVESVNECDDDKGRNKGNKIKRKGEHCSFVLISLFSP